MRGTTEVPNENNTAELSGNPYMTSITEHSQNLNGRKIEMRQVGWLKDH